MALRQLPGREHSLCCCGQYKGQQDGAIQTHTITADVAFRMHVLRICHLPQLRRL